VQGSAEVPLRRILHALGPGCQPRVTPASIGRHSRDNRDMPALPLAASLGILACALAAGCLPGSGETQPPPADPKMTAERERMVAEQIASRDVHDARVLAAMREVPRHLFVAEALRAQAYDDHPLQIGHGQTISQPYIVALMTELARPAPSDRALEIGTGSGYQAAVLSRLVSHVYSVELNEALHEQAAERLARLGYRNVTAVQGDGYKGWPGAAPYDIVLVTAAPEDVPEALVAQLKPGGRLVIPVGGYFQELQLVEKDMEGRTRTRSIAPVMFVPLVKDRK
jgi:protein-L-isoaspartate(D-aspartate) O-methyltransferase